MPFFTENRFEQGPTGSQGSSTAAPQDSPGFLDYLTDVPMGILRGGVSFGESLAELADSGAELLGGDLFEGNDLTWSEDLLGENKTWVGDLTQGISQFAFGFVPVAGVLGKAGKAGRALKGLKDSKRIRDSLAYGAIVGAPTDFIAFNGHEGRLSDLIESFPALQNPISAALASDPDDSEWEGRFKNAVEGLIVGGPAELLLSSLRFLRGAKNAEAKGGIKGRDDWVNKNQEKYQEELSNIEDPLTLSEAQNQLADLGYKPDEVDAWTALVGATSKRFGVDDDTLVGLTVHKVERGTASNPEALQQTAALRIGEETLELGGRANLKNIQSALHERSIGILGKPLDLAKGKDIDKVVDQLVDEVDFQIKDSGLDSGEHWYGQEMTKAFDSLTRIEPRLQGNDSYQGLFKAVLAITSNGNKVGLNSEYALRAFRGWLDTGGKRFQDKTINGKGFGRRGGSITQALRGLEELIDRWGIEKTSQWLSEEHTIKHLREVKRSLSVYSSKGNGNIAGLQLDSKRGSLMFGPKVGEFFQNVDGNTVRGTFDIWWTRTFRRLSGQLDQGSDAPKNAADRERMQVVAEKAAQKMGLEVADLQAVAWYYEQGLYRDLGSTNVSESFSHAFKRIEAEERFTPGTPRNEAAALEADARRQGSLARAAKPGHAGSLQRRGRPASRLQQAGGGDAGPRGEVDFDTTDGRAVISLFETADVSTLVHETGHVFRRNLHKFDPELAKKADDAFGIGDEGWTRAKEEEFTDSFESYLKDGKAPNPTLKKVFENFKAWMTDIYRNITGTKLSDKISPEVRDFFDEMLGGRTAKQRNLDVPVKVKEAIAEKLSAVTRGEVELDEALEGIDLNLDKLMVDVEAKKLINIISEELEGQIKALKGGVESLNTTAQKALNTIDEDLGADGGLIDRLRTKQADAKDVIAAKMVLSGLSSKIVDLGKKMDLGNANKRETLQLVRHIEEMAHLQADLKANITEAARITSAGRIPIESSVTADKLDELLSRAGGTKRVRDVVKQLKMVEGNPRNVMKVVRSRWDTKARKFINVHNEVWLNSILSGPITHAVNLISTLTHGIARSAEKGIGGLVLGDLASSREGLDELGGLVFSMKNALKFSAQSFKSGDTVLDVGHRTIDTANPGRGEISGRGSKSPMGRMLDLIGGTVRTPSRFLTSEDEFNKQLFYRSHLYAKGLADARRLGISSGPKRTKHVLKYIESRIDEGGRALDESALYHAQEGTFTNDLGYGFGKTLQGLVNKHPLARLALPFVRTPTNIFRQLWRHTPGLAAFQEQWAADFKGINGAERKAMAVGQQVMGMTLLFGGVAAASSGRITGGGPTDLRELALLRQTGWQPYSIVTTDEFGNKKYTSYQRLDPFASAIGLIADYAELGNRVDPEEQNEMAIGMMTAFAKNITNKTYLRGLSEAVDVLTDPDRNVERWMRRQAGSYVPNLFNQLNPDDTLREVRTYMDAVKARTPGFSQTLDPRRNVFGQPVTYEGSLGPDFVSPFYQSTGLNSAARDELVDLGIALGQPREKQEGIDLTTLKVAPNQSSYDRWLELVGQVKIQNKGLEEYLNELVKSETYQRLPAQSTMPSGVDSSRVKLVKRGIERYRNRALMEMFKEQPEIKDMYQKAMVNNRRISVLGAQAAQ